MEQRLNTDGPEIEWKPFNAGRRVPLGDFHVVWHEAKWAVCREGIPAPLERFAWKVEALIAAMRQAEPLGVEVYSHHHDGRVSSLIQFPGDLKLSSARGRGR